MQVISSILDISAEEWDSVATMSSKAPERHRPQGSGRRREGASSEAPSETSQGANEVPYEVNPFMLHAFLSALEESRSAVPDAGWLPKHLIVRSV